MVPRGVLVTRPEPGAAETAAAIAALGWDPVLAPALILRSCAPAQLPPAQAILFASRAAARALPPGTTPVLAVGAGTAAEARRRGFATVIEAAGDAAALATLAAARLDPARGPLLLAVGRGYGADLAAALRARGFRVVRRVVYAAAPAPALPAAAVAALTQRSLAAALFTSPRGAEVTVDLLRQSGLSEAVRGVRAIAISARVAGTLRGLPWSEISVPARPDPGLLPALLGHAPS